jgi:hypothetical protein
MEWAAVLLLMAFIGYLLYDETLGEQPVLHARKRLCDYYAPGSVYEDIPSALKRGVRLLEVHVYADEQDKPVVALHAQNEGYDYATDNITFEQVCVLIENDAFPSEDPFILSIVPHTEKTIVMNRVAEHLLTTIRKRLVKTEKNIATAPLDSLKNKVVIVSGRNIHGTDLEPLVNLSWSGSLLRRLSYQQALHPRDEPDLIRYNRDNITIVAPEIDLKTIKANPDRPLYFGCQWNLYDRSGGGFTLKPEPLRTESFLRVKQNE